jgi:hypothetical protein
MTGEADHRLEAARERRLDDDAAVDRREAPISGSQKELEQGMRRRGHGAGFVCGVAFVKVTGAERVSR